ncbi:hypothetical protein [Acerihabitans arboris]|nr:hypothetical protein [Acerihabitans arboris]
MGVEIKGLDGEQPGKAAIVTQGKVVNRIEALRLCQTEDSINPIMSYYAKGKRVDFSPAEVAAQQGGWAQEIKEAQNIFIIGVFINYEVDTHIWENLSLCRGNIHYFGGKDDKTYFDKWKDNIKKENIYFHEGYFDLAVEFITKYR